jgi:hypothetical protein
MAARPVEHTCCSLTTRSVQVAPDRMKDVPLITRRLARQSSSFWSQIQHWLNQQAYDLDPVTKNRL